jgi:CubicO group peptidase (beta-lactamase class C family)
MPPSRKHTLATAVFVALIILGLGASAQVKIGVDMGRLKQVDALIERNLSEKQYSGVVALIARKGKIVYFNAQGVMDISSNKPMPKDAIFRLASMTKVVTAVAILILVEEGRLRLTDPVSRFIPKFKNLKVAVANENGIGFTLEPARREITIFDLLTHTSGLGSGVIPTTEMAKEPPKQGDNLAIVVSRLPNAPLEFQPGTRFSYSGLAGFDTLGRIVEVVSGISLEQFFQQRVFQPLGMTCTTFAPNQKQRERLVTLYSKTGTGLTKAPIQDLLIDSVCYHGAGGLVGSTEDYFRFAQMLLNGGVLNGTRILSPRMVQMLGSAQLREQFPGLPKGNGWGLGVRYITSGESTNTLLSTGTYGWSGAWGTHFWIDPSQNLVAIFMGNETSAGGAGAISARDFETAVMQAVTTLNK